MITKPQKTSHQYLRKILVLPLSVLIITLFAFRFHERKAIHVDSNEPPIVVVVDPGHGGSDPGVSSPDKKYDEASLSLQLAKTIQELAPEYNVKVVLTRESQTWSDGIKSKDEALQHAVLLTKSSKADAFISLHINSDNKPGQFQQTNTGFEAYISAKKDDKNGRQLAGAILQNLSDIYETSKLIRERKDAGIYVLDKNIVPSLLLQCGYINNKSDLNFIIDKSNQEKIARQILIGLKDFKNSPIAINPENENPVDTSKAFFKENWGFDLTVAEVDVEKPGYNSSTKNTVPDLVIFNGEEYSGKDFKSKMKYVKSIKAKKIHAIPPGNANAVETYGERARNGVIEFSDATIEMNLNTVKDYSIILDKPVAQPLIVVDGKVIKEGITSLNSIDPNTIESINVLKNESATSIYGEEGKNGVIVINLKSQKFQTLYDLKQEVKDAQLSEVKRDYEVRSDKQLKVIDQEIRIFEKMEIEPAFPGGTAAWSEYLKRNLNKNVGASNGAPKGNYTVLVQFVVFEDGHIEDIKALTNHGFGMEKEAIRIIQKSPNWLPGIQNGRKINGIRKQPINFNVGGNITAIQLPEVVLVAYMDSKTKLKNINENSFAAFKPSAAGSIEWRKYLERNINSLIPLSEKWKAGNYQILIQFERRNDGSIANVKALNNANSKTAKHCVALVKQLPNVLPSDNVQEASTVYIQPLLFTLLEDPKKPVASL